VLFVEQFSLKFLYSLLTTACRFIYDPGVFRFSIHVCIVQISIKCVSDAEIEPCFYAWPWL